ncbi:high nitrogen upregulated cytochrome P450 monooxygenase 2 [Multifurca ochricompacta]|uniref:High nitrogen upregulated cytochrome P450 monooxygenase 2 n=1 Tax=Multifurca ochricompacta TaxID=376703 RepID=A0AAD4QP11_9AGAM|nr:high nitrogen upregulated cytochrome P450 monooxygenase 2 [Multifurca ochricompacta]
MEFPLTNSSNSDAALLYLSTSFATYLYFKRFEPYKFFTLFTLLLIPPAFLTISIASLFSSNIVAFISSLVIYNSLVLTYTAAYRLSPWHPLANYPGPILARLSKFYFVLICAKGKQHLYYSQLHEIYGDYVRVGPNELSIRDASVIHPVLGSGGLQKGPFWDHRPPSLIASRDAADHARKRKSWNHAFTSAALKEYEVIITRRLRQLVECIDNSIKESAKEKRGSLVNICAWFEYFATDFMGDMAFGGGFELMRDGSDIGGVWHILESGYRNATIVAHAPWILPYIAYLPSAGRNVMRLRKYGLTSVTKRLEMGPNRKDLFYYLSGEDGQAEKLPTNADLAGDGILAMIAGSDTTSITLTTLFYHLIHNPVMYERLRDEVEREFPSGEEPLDATKLGQMPWLNACINEAMRLHPAVPSGSQRSVLRGTGPKVLGKHVIPEQTQLFLHTHSIHRDARNFSMPNTFLPQRWIASEAEKNTASGITVHNTTAFFPFSYGPTRYDFQAVPGYDMKQWEDTLCDYFAIQKGPLMIKVTARN